MEELLISLPDQIKSLQQLVHEQAEVIAQLKQTEQKNQRYIAYLEESLFLARQRQFGARTEKHADQIELNLFDGQGVSSPNRDDEQDSTIEVAAHQRRRKRTHELPEHLPRVVVEHDLSDAEKHCDCGVVMNRIGHDASEQLSVIPPQWYVIRHLRHKYACPNGCIETAPMPAQPIASSQASPQLLAHTIVSKFHDGLPLYRQTKIAARQGIDLASSKLARWLIQLLPLFQPLFNLLQEALISYDITQIDATGLQVLDEPGRRAESKSYFWIRRGGPPDRPVVLVNYEPSKSGDTVWGLLDQTHGYLVCDAAKEFNLSIERGQLSVVYCNDHARRKFKQVLKAVGDQKKTQGWAVTKAIRYYKKLYRLEKEIADQSPGQKYLERQRRALPIWDEFLHWAEAELNAGIAHQRSRNAFEYLLKHAQGLRRYCDDGRLPISNIQSEHVAKTIAVPRKNFLFAKTVEGAQANAMCYSLLESAKLNGHNVHHYLAVVIAALPRAQCVEEFEALLPWNLTPQQASERYHQLPKP